VVGLPALRDRLKVPVRPFGSASESTTLPALGVPVISHWLGSFGTPSESSEPLSAPKTSRVSSALFVVQLLLMNVKLVRSIRPVPPLPACSNTNVALPLHENVLF